MGRIVSPPPHTHRVYVEVLTPATCECDSEIESLQMYSSEDEVRLNQGQVPVSRESRAGTDTRRGKTMRRGAGRTPADNRGRDGRGASTSQKR